MNKGFKNFPFSLVACALGMFQMGMIFGGHLTKKANEARGYVVAYQVLWEPVNVTTWGCVTVSDLPEGDAPEVVSKLRDRIGEDLKTASIAGAGFDRKLNTPSVVISAISRIPGGGQ